jgi:molybdopterin/thiamine biosynthesis adenylyltransferase
MVMEEILLPVSIDIESVLQEDRYSRLRLIPWWDQEKLRSARILIVGAGAIGNEILKNLALLGIGQVVIVDLDRIENSNLSRSVLFRAGDEGSYKAEVAARRMQEINPDVQTTWIAGNVLTDIGLGLFHWADVVLGGLDNREARLFLNRACWKTGRPFVDGAIEALHGFARVFLPPDGACYECTMTETDWKLLEKRKSCSLLTRSEMQEGKIPTTPTSASVIAGIEVQEMLKLLHSSRDLPVLAGRCFVFNGLNHDSYVIEYQRKDDCLSHETFEGIEELDADSTQTTAREVLTRMKATIGEDAVLELGRDIVSGLHCSCGYERSVFRPLESLGSGDGECPRCGHLVQIDTFHDVYGTEDFLDRTLADIGIPPYEILTGRAGTKEIHYEIAGDRDRVFRFEGITIVPDGMEVER